MKIIVTGANGLVGSHFTENYNSEDNVIIAPSFDKLDITDQKSVERFFSSHQPDAIIHFAAFTDVSLAEKQRNNKKSLSWKVNVEGTANLIKAAGHKPYFIFISTDVVFSGSKRDPGPYSEDHPVETDPDALSWYGWTKREGEKLVSQNLKNAAILRISNPVRAYYPSKLDYIRKILFLYDNEKLYPLFKDQYLTLTYINEITETLKILLKKPRSGIFHTSSSNVFTPYKLANLLIERTRGRKNAAKPISIESFLADNPSRYPKYGGLNVKKTQDRLGFEFKKWEQIVEDLAEQLSI